MAVFAGQHKDYKGGYSNRPSGTSSAGSGYTPGGDSYKNYSASDQQIMFDQAGGKKNFQNQVANVEQKYKRSADIQNFLNRSNRYQTGQMLGGKQVMSPDGIMRLQMAGMNTPMRDALGRQMLSMQAPSVTAQAPTFGQFMGDIGGGISNMMGAGADFIMGGGTLGKVLGGLKDKFTQGKNFLGGMMNPGDISGQLQVAGPEAQRMYGQFMQQPGMTYQKAFEMATGTPFSTETNSSVASSTPSNIPATLSAGPPNQNMSGLGSIGQAIYQMYINMGRSNDEALTESREFERQMAERGFTQAKPSDGGGYSFMAQGGIASLN